MTTALYYDDLFLRHDTGMHPESAERLVRIVDDLMSSGLWDRCDHPPGRDAEVEEIALVHDREYIDALLQLAEEGGGQLDFDTPVSRDSGRAALRAAGHVLDAVETVLKGDAANALCLVRPPGHHARPERGMGFCLFNNIAIAAASLLERHGLKRVAIVDWDAHHGNGTQEAFWLDGRVIYLSLHLWPYYPGTGGEDEAGAGEGEDKIVNVPLPLGVRGETFVEQFQAGLERVRNFSPEFTLISAGFDSYVGDPLAGAGLAVEDYRTLTDLVTTVAKACCDGRLVSTLEGGYNLEALPKCVAAHLEGLLAADGSGT